MYVYLFSYREAIEALQRENEELRKDNVLAGSTQNLNKVSTILY